MENLIEAIRTALLDDAEPIARRAGLVACRKILAVLETATEGEPAAAPAGSSAAAPSSSSPVPEPASATPAPATPIDPAAVATLLASLGKLPPEQLLDLAITRLRAALPPGVSVAAPTPLRFQLVPVQYLERSK